MENYTIEVSLLPDSALDAVRDAAEAWGANWHRTGRAGRIELPVSAGLRYGMLGGEITGKPTESGTLLDLQIEESAYRIHLPALSILAVGAAGAITMIIAPLIPGLFALVPVGFIVMLCTWFLVLSRLEHRGPSEFLELVRDVGDHPLPPEDDDDDDSSAGPSPDGEGPTDQDQEAERP